MFNFFDNQQNDEPQSNANAFLQRIIDHLPQTGKALDLPTGEGRNALLLAKRGLEVLALDLSSVGVFKASRLAAREGFSIQAQAADISQYEFGSEQFDVITSIWLHLPSPTREAVAKKLSQALKPGGYFVGVYYHPAQTGMGTGGPSDKRWLCPLSEVQKNYPGLHWLIGEEQEVELNEGPFHQGNSVVVYVLGQKPDFTD